MLKKEVEIGATYMVKVSGVVVPVRIVRLRPGGGWIGVSTASGREITIKSGRKLRQKVQLD